MLLYMYDDHLVVSSNACLQAPFNRYLRPLSRSSLTCVASSSSLCRMTRSNSRKGNPQNSISCGRWPWRKLAVIGAKVGINSKRKDGMYGESIIEMPVHSSLDRTSLTLVEDSRTGCSRTRNSKARRPNGRDRFACPLKFMTKRVRYLYQRAISG